MLQSEKSAGNLNNGYNLMHGGIPSTILPVKSKVVRSFTSSGNQSLEQIMKRANEIIKKSKNTAGQGGRPDITDILHPLTDSFVTLTTADSLQKNSQSTNREGCKVSPFVTVSSPENTESKKSNPISSDKSTKAKSKISSGSAGQDDNLSARVNIAKQLHNNYMSEADYVFENFDTLFKVSFVPQSSNQQHSNHFAQKQNGPSQHTSFSANAKDNDNSCKIALAEVFERIRREEKSLQQQQNKQQGINQSQQQQQNNTPSSIHLRSHSSIVNTGDNSYLVPKQVQQTTSSFISKNQQQQQQQQPSIQQQLSSSFNQSNSQQTSHQISSQFKDTNYTSSQSNISNQQASSQQSQIINSEIETYLKKPQPAKIKTQSGAPLHPHPPLPQSTKININGYNTNHFNQQRFRYRNSLKDKENIQDAGNTSMNQLNLSNGQIMTNPNKNGSFLCTPVAANHNNIPIPQQYQAIQNIQMQQQQQQQSHVQNQHQHQRSSSNIADISYYLNNNNNNNAQQNNASNSLQNSFGFYRPRVESFSGSTSNNMISERLNTIGIEQNIKTSNYASLKERTNSNNNSQINDISCDKSANYSSMRVNTSYNGNQSQNQNQSNNNNNSINQSQRGGSFQLNIPKMTVSKLSAPSSILNSLLGSQKVQQPQPTNTSQNSNNTSISQAAYNPAGSSQNQGSRSNSVPRSNLGFLMQKKAM